MLRLFAFFAVLIIFLQSGGVIPFFLARQYVHRFELEERLEHQHKQLIRLSAEEYHKARINRSEIRLDGMMYDVVDMEVADNEVRLMVISDAHEEGIVKQLNRLFDDEEGMAREWVKKLLSFHFLVPDQYSVFFETIEYVYYPLMIVEDNNLFLPNIFSPPRG